ARRLRVETSDEPLPHVLVDLVREARAHEVERRLARPEARDAHLAGVAPEDRLGLALDVLGIGLDREALLDRTEIGELDLHRCVGSSWRKVVSRPGIEPGTRRLRVCCSAN